MVQGAGAGLVSPAALAGAVSGFPPERRGRALGIWGASAGMSNLLGPLLGGVLTVALGWRADWWALVPLTIAAGLAIARLMPVIVHADKRDHPALNRIVLAATLVAGLTFAVMIGAFYIAEQYLPAGGGVLGAGSLRRPGARGAAGRRGRAPGREARRSPRGATARAARVRPLGPGSHGPRDPGHDARRRRHDPAADTDRPGTRDAVRADLAGPHSTPVRSRSHGRTSALLSVGRLLGATVGAGLAVSRCQGR